MYLIHILKANLDAYFSDVAMFEVCSGITLSGQLVYIKN